MNIFSTQKLLIILLYSYVFFLPLGAAGQNIFVALSGLVLLAHSVKSADAKQRWQQFCNDSISKHFVVAYLIFIGIMVSSGLINGDIPAYKLLEYIAGYLSFLILPIAGAICPPLSFRQQRHLTRIALGVTALLTVICLSQLLIGWKLSGWQVIDEQQRARGFYSHPLTMAYVLLLFWPFHSIYFLKQPSNKIQACFFSCWLLMTYAVKSRITQIVSLATLIWNIWHQSSKRQRNFAFSLLAAILLALTIFPNPVRTLFIKTWNGTEDRHALEYRDDRLAFWHAHWQLVKQAPILGHGPHYPREKRHAAYAQIGLDNFTKKYTAHNTYLELWVTGGIIGLLAFGSWLFSIWRLVSSLSPTARSIGRQTLIAFMFAILTQNAWQDNEVRFAIAGIIAVALHFRQQLLHNTANK